MPYLRPGPLLVGTVRCCTSVWACARVGWRGAARPSGSAPGRAVRCRTSVRVRSWSGRCCTSVWACARLDGVVLRLRPGPLPAGRCDAAPSVWACARLDGAVPYLRVGIRPAGAGRVGTRDGALAGAFRPCAYPHPQGAAPAGWPSRRGGLGPARGAVPLCPPVPPSGTTAHNGTAGRRHPRRVQAPPGGAQAQRGAGPRRGAQAQRGAGPRRGAQAHAAGAPPSGGAQAHDRGAPPLSGRRLHPAGRSPGWVAVRGRGRGPGWGAVGQGSARIT